jgi:hypothetical protein
MPSFETMVDFLGLKLKNNNDANEKAKFPFLSIGKPLLRGNGVEGIAPYAKRHRHWCATTVKRSAPRP